MEHTKEPWKHNIDTRVSADLIIENEYGELIATVDEFYGNDEYNANAERIVTCVNAMQGLTNEQVESLRETVKELRSVTEAFFSLYDKYANDNPSEDHLADYAKDILTRSKHLS